MNQNLITEYRTARYDKSLAVLEGFHALKHALIHNANIIKAHSNNQQKLLSLFKTLSPIPYPKDLIEEIDNITFQNLSPRPPRTNLIAIAKRSAPKPPNTTNPSIILDNPKDHHNIGAIIRVISGLNASQLISIGDNDPWHPNSIRAAAGLHFSLPVTQTREYIKKDNHFLVSFTPEGDPLNTNLIPKNAYLVFGSERHGISDTIKQQSDLLVRLPMKNSVTSYNLATSVAMGLFAITQYGK